MALGPRHLAISPQAALNVLPVLLAPYMLPPQATMLRQNRLFLTLVSSVPKKVLKQFVAGQANSETFPVPVLLFSPNTLLYAAGTP